LNSALLFVAEYARSTEDSQFSSVAHVSVLAEHDWMIGFAFGGGKRLGGQ
jgi:hypothetical protein